jgi:hypothetical protein
MVDVLDTKEWSPQQALLKVMDEHGDMQLVAIAYIRKDEDCPRITCSSMSPKDMNFLGFALQQYSLSCMGGETEVN